MNNLLIPCDTNEISDGHHTFGELYEHRCLLFANLVLQNKEKSFKVKHYDEWFILGMNTEFGQITYHLPIKFWDILKSIPESQDYVWDGHTSKDVIIRLEKLMFKEN